MAILTGRYTLGIFLIKQTLLGMAIRLEWIRSFCRSGLSHTVLLFIFDNYFMFLSVSAKQVASSLPNTLGTKPGLHNNVGKKQKETGIPIR